MARCAGLGIGTLYRHFPTREALFQSVYRDEIDQLVALARQLPADAEPADALRRWLHANIGVVATKRGMLAALAPSTEGAQQLFANSRTLLVAATDALMRRAREAGALRGDVAADDVLRTLFGLCYAHDGPGWQAKATLLIDVFLDGLAVRREASPGAELCNQ